MRRRDFIKAGAAAMGAVSAGGKAKAGSKPAPDYMPIVKEKMEGGGYNPCYVERELTRPVMLCDEKGRLNPEAVGWARTPLVRANLKGHWPRKKRWNFWNWIGPSFVFSVTLSDIDFASFCAVSFTDFKTKENFSGIAIKGPGLDLPEEVERSVSFSGSGVEYDFINEGGDIKVTYQGPLMKGGEATAEFTIRKPPGHETLNIVVPWSPERFQMNSKHNTLPVEGSVTVAGRRYVMDPEECHGVQDFGRGMWPYRSYWNWGVATGKSGPNLLGVNLGAKWTTGTGSNENGICYNGRLYKVMEDLIWEYDPHDWMKPWRVRSGCSDTIDLTLTPFIANPTSLSLGLIRTGGTCSFGHWNGAVRIEGETVPVDNLIGWAEEFSHRW